MVIGVFSFSELFSKGLQCLLRSNLHFQRIEPFNDLQFLLLKAENGEEMDLLIMDLDDYKGDPLADVRHILIKKPGIKVLLIGNHENESSLELFRLNGAKGYVDRNASFEKLHLAIDLCLDGKPYFPPGKTRGVKFFTSNFFNKLRDDYQLSDREMEIMQLIFCQYETNEIAEKLSLSPHTVRTHRKRIYKKLKIHNLSGLLHLMP
jgi:DNA-binding NarL/FixJ family response regulator